LDDTAQNAMAKKGRQVTEKSKGVAEGAGASAAQQSTPPPASQPGDQPVPTPAPAAPRAVSVPGLSETLQDVRHELRLFSYASKFDWVNKRLIVLRNAIIAFSVIAGVAAAAIIGYREAYRQTLNISPFDVPERLAERGITGRVAAKALFDELVKRRKTVTTLDAGDLKEAWTEHRSDVALPESHFTLQSVFRFLRHLTGNEVLIDGEVLLDGDDATIKVRVAGHPPHTVRGNINEWDALLGKSANYVYEITQPAVLASYLGLTAKTPEDLAALSRYVVSMMNSNPRLSRGVMAVAYDAYGGALMRQDQLIEALAAFNQAMYYDPQFGLAVMNAAEVNFRLDKSREATKLYERASHMQISETAKREALRRRVSAALNNGDCAAGEAALRQAKAVSHYDEQWERWMEARFLVACAYEEEKAVEIARGITTLHPDSANAWVYLSAVLLERPGQQYLPDVVQASRQAINKSTEPKGILNYFAHLNLIDALARLGQTEQAMRIYEDAKDIVKVDRPDLRSTLASILYAKGEFGAAEIILLRLMTPPSSMGAGDYRLLGQTLDKLGKHEEGLVTFRAGQKIFPANCSLYDEAGKSLLKQQRMKEALLEFARGTAALEKCGLPYISAARALIGAQRTPEARIKLQTLIRIAPTSDGAREAGEILAGLAKSH
jgi:tetratricopeptide (TPR) repeat protein